MLAWLGGDDAAVRPARLRAFETILLFSIAVEYWSRGLPKWDSLGTQYLATAVAISLLAGGSLLWPATRQAIFAAVALLHAGIVVAEFPEAANHSYLQVGLCSLCALLDLEREAEQELLLRAARFLFCVVIFYAGLQKLLSGYWFAGQYLAFSLSRPSFQLVLAPLLPTDELARLTAYRGALGDGPYRVTAPLFLFLSNAVYVAEIGLVPLLAWRRTRTLAALAAIALIVAIEVAAREAFFGLLFINLALLFLPGNANRRLLAPIGVGLAYLMLVRFGVAPELVFQ